MISVLYVDDEPTLLDIGKLFLERGGQFVVDTITSAPEALALLDTRDYDAIISDYQMPEMDGIEFLRRVRTSGNTIPFILFTGRGREEVVIQALNEGADFYLQKGGEPVSQFTELAHKVRQAVQKSMAEMSVRDHEQREADIISFLPDATFAIDTHGMVIAWNKAMEKMTGVRASEILGKGDYEYALPFYHERRPVLIDFVLRDDPAIVARYPCIKRDGQKLFSEITISHFNESKGADLWFTACPLYDTRGLIVGAIESIRDITERKRTEQALNESEKFLNNVVENIPDMIFVKDARDLRFVRFNKAGEKLLGYMREDLYGKSDYDFFPKDEADFFTRKDRAVLDRMQIVDIPEEKIHTRLMGERILHTKKIPILDETGKPSYLMGISEDITDRKQAEMELGRQHKELEAAYNQLSAQENELRQRMKDIIASQSALRKSEEKFRVLIENASESIVIAQEEYLKFVNQSVIELSGYPEEELLSRPFLEFVHPDDRTTIAANYQHWLLGEFLGVYTFRLVRRDGEVLVVEIRATLILWDGSPATLNFIMDITKQKQAEIALPESEGRNANRIAGRALLP